MATARMNCPYGWPLEVAHKIQVCRKGDGSGNWRCGKGWKRLDRAPYCKPSKRARQQQATGTQGSPLFALSPPSLVVGSVLAETRPDFVCVNLDFWPDAKQCSQQDCVVQSYPSCASPAAKTSRFCVRGEPSDYRPAVPACCPWRGASLLDTSLSALEPYVRALSGGGGLLVRMGGSLQDVVRYAADAMSAGCRPFAPDASRRVGFSEGCLTVARWLELHGMCQRAGCRFVFGVNALSGRQRRSVPECSAIGQINQARRLVGKQAVSPHARALFAACTRWDGEWEPSHVAVLLRAAAAHNVSTLAALSFGNEINGERGMEAQLSPRAYARGLRRLADLVNEIWPRKGRAAEREGGEIPRERPELIAGEGNWNQAWRTLAVAPTLTLTLSLFPNPNPNP